MNSRNVYFEVPSQSGRPKRMSSMGLSNNSSSETKTRALRGHLEQTSSKGRTPVEWQQWLRHTRRDPPTSHDILMNEALSMRTKQRALESDRKHQLWKEKVLKEFLSLIALLEHCYFRNWLRKKKLKNSRKSRKISKTNFMLIPKMILRNGAQENKLFIQFQFKNRLSKL